VSKLLFLAGRSRSESASIIKPPSLLTRSIRYEVDREEKIGIGFFSDVFKGSWRGHAVAIKVLAESTPRKLFVREIGIWKTLRHPNVLKLYGASSATGDPPWFFVSPYLKNGSLVEYLKRIEHDERPAGLGLNTGIPTAPLRSPGLRTVSLPTPWSSRLGSVGLSSSSNEGSSTSNSSTSREGTHVQREWNLFRFMYEIAKGMEYLHSNGVLHGDLKAANVLVDNKFRCVISDFGLSEMKSEAYRISGTAPPRQFLLSHESLMLTSNFRRNASVAIPRAHVWSKPADSRG